jgi:hypothetical protein
MNSSPVEPSLTKDRIKEIAVLFGQKFEKIIIFDIEEARGFYHATLAISESHPSAREVDRELNRIRNKAKHAHSAVWNLVRELDNSTMTARLAINNSTKTARLAINRQSNAAAENTIHTALSILGELQNLIYPHLREVGGERHQWERESFISRLIEIFEDISGEPVNRTIKDTIHTSDFLEFVKLCSTDLPGFKDEGDTALSSAIKRVIELQDEIKPAIDPEDKKG